MLQETNSLNSSVQYADLLEIEDIEEGASICSIIDPWDTSHYIVSYCLIPSDNEYWTEERATKLSQQYGGALLLHTPLQRMAVTTACHSWLMLQLKAEDHITVMCDTGYVISSEVRQWMRSTNKEGKAIISAGTSVAPNQEVLLKERCDAIWLSPYENMSMSKMSHINIPIIYCADYMETSPLGRAEWMKFYGRLVDKSHGADSLFAEIAKRYENNINSNIKHQRLLTELPYGATWFVPGGCSTAAQLYADAGYDYLWSDDTHSGSLSLSKEAVLAKSQDADIWLIKYNDPTQDWTLETLGKQSELFRHIKAFQDHNVYGCNTARSDFFDITPFRPDTLLLSLCHLDSAFFHILP